MIHTEAWFLSLASPETAMADLFRKWESGVLDDVSYKAMMRQLLGGTSESPQKATSMGEWVEALKAAKMVVGEIAAKMEAKTRAGELPSMRLHDDMSALRQMVWESLESAQLDGKPSPHVDPKRLQSVLTKVMGQVLPGQPVPNIEFPT